MKTPSSQEEPAPDVGLEFLAGRAPRPPATSRERLLVTVGHLLRAQHAAWEAEMASPDEAELARVRALTAEEAPRRAWLLPVALAAGMAGLICGGLLALSLRPSAAEGQTLLGQDVVTRLPAPEAFSSSDPDVRPVVDLAVQTRDPLAWAGALAVALGRSGVPVNLRMDGAQRPIVLEVTLPQTPGAALSAVLRQARLPVTPGVMLRLLIERGSN